MKLILTTIEVRILGCLIEKQATTPDVYPLTLNSLLSACNQKSNREPVMELAESEVLEALDSLKEHTLASVYVSGRSRAEKYQHKLHHRAFADFDFSTPQLAVLCALFLRGPQTLGEIRSRCARIYDFADLGSVVSVLKELEDNENGPYVCLLPRQAGRKESRYGHLFCGAIEETNPALSAGQVSSAVANSQQGNLQEEISQLKERLHSLEQRFDEFVKQFE